VSNDFYLMIENKKSLQKTDEELVALTLKNQDYYACLVSRYETKIMRYILRISSFSKEDAEDVLQEVFIKVYRNLNDFDQNLKFSSWIYRIAHNEVISHYRKMKSRPTLVITEADEWLKTIAGNDDLEKDLDRKLTTEEIKNVLSRMDIKYREVLALRYLEEKDYREISDILEKPMGTVATLINRAKKQFKEESESGGPGNLSLSYERKI
jgi:RNA polymerase sigma-70 factor, ECF subfamily